MGRLSALAKMATVDSSMDVIDYIISLLPADTKKGYGSEWKVNCQSCMRIEHGARNDTKHRGGFRIDGSGFMYHCFNCGYSCRYDVGQFISKNCLDLFRDLGCSDLQLQQLKMLAFANLSDDDKENYMKNSEELKKHKYQNLPAYYMDIQETLNNPFHMKNERFLKCYNYLMNRNPLLLRWNHFYWSCQGDKAYIGIKNIKGDDEFGYILKGIEGNTSRYINSLPMGAIFNYDTIKDGRKFNIVVEGVFDAISLNCLGLLGNELSDAKLKNLKFISDNQKLIYVPDRDKAGLKAVEELHKQQFPIAISCPNFDVGIKDVADAVVHYGRPYTIKMILDSVIEDNWGYALLKAKMWCRS